MSKLVLIADDDCEFARAVALRCRRLGLRTLVAHDALAAFRLADAHRPDLMCLDVNMPGGNGLSACELMSGSERLRDVPVIVLTGDTGHETIRRCHQLAAYYVLKCPEVWPRVEPLLRELLELPAQGAGDDAQAGTQPAATDSASPGVDGPSTAVAHGSQAAAAPTANFRASFADREREVSRELQGSLKDLLEALEDFLPLGHAGDKSTAPPQEHVEQGCPWVLSIDDDREFSYALKVRLESHGVAVVRAFDGADGYAAAFAYPADAILLDYQMPRGLGDEVLARLKGHPLTRDIPVVVLTGRRERELEQSLVRLGAAACLHKPVDTAALLAELGKHIPVLPSPRPSPAAAG